MQRKMTRISRLAVWLTAAMLTACNGGTMFHNYVSVSPEGWTRRDTVTFTLPPVPDKDTFDLYMGMRYASAFPYEGIWVVVETDAYHPPLSRCDTIYFAMVNDEGNVSGQGVTLRQREQHVATLALHEGQMCTVRLRHIMEQETLPAITDVGMRITARH